MALSVKVYGMIIYTATQITLKNRKSSIIANGPINWSNGICLNGLSVEVYNLQGILAFHLNRFTYLGDSRGNSIVAAES